ncbi:unnamed protein product [Schistosoma turkestanicum]|nr:unnamed protein product [Schistosoma turkestanicum]
MLLTVSTTFLIVLIITTEIKCVTSEQQIQVSILTSDQPDCHLLCELCTSTINATKYILDEEPFLPKLLQYFMPICYMLPKLEYRKICYHLVDGGVVSIIHEMLNKMNENEIFYHIGLCNSIIPCPSVQNSLTCKYRLIDMLIKIVLLLFLFGLKEIVFGEAVERSENELEALEFQLICETCVMNVRGIRWLLLQGYARKMIAELSYVLCNFIPYKQPRALCKQFFDGPFEKLVHDFVVNMSVYEPCYYLGLCETVQQESMISADNTFYTDLLMKTLSIVKEDIESIITPESIQQTAKELCSSNKMCTKTFKKSVMALIDVIYKNSEGEWFSDDFTH